MNAQEIIKTDKANYMEVFARCPIVLSHGEGPYVYDVDGNKYLDFLAGIAVNIVGHGHPTLVKAIAEQAAKMIHVSNLYYTEQQATLSEALVKLSGLGRVFLANSGAEANEGAIKLARKYGKTLAADRVEIVSAEHSFHGRTLSTLTATGQPKYREGYDPLPPGFLYVPYGDLEALEALVSAKTCAVMLEPIQGEGGVHVPDESYLKAVRELCDTHGALLIFDEIQTGVGRTGKMFAYEHLGFKPDIVTLAKGLGGGVPIGAVIASEKAAKAFGPGDHGSTFGGNPLACAAANAVLRIIKEEKILENVTEVGAYLAGELTKLKAEFPNLISEVRGQGLLAGLKLTFPGKEIAAGCLAKGVIVNCTAGDVIRLAPPLIVKKHHVDECIGVLREVLASC